MLLPMRLNGRPLGLHGKTWQTLCWVTEGVICKGCSMAIGGLAIHSAFQPRLLALLLPSHLPGPARTGGRSGAGPPAAVGLEAASSAAGLLTSEGAAARLVSEPCVTSRGRLAFVNPSSSASTGSSAHHFAVTNLLNIQATCLAILAG